MENILHPNYQALADFAGSVTKDLAPGNKHVKMINCLVTYNWNFQERTIETLATIRLNDEPYANIELTAKDWLNANDQYLKLTTGYKKNFSFDAFTRTLTIEDTQPSKMGGYYRVIITEVPYFG